jgi:hypothetical protein
MKNALNGMVVALVCVSCAHVDTAAQDVTTWLECVECEPAALKAVTQHGEAVVPLLDSVVQRGPSAIRLERLRATLQAGYEWHSRAARLQPERQLHWTNAQYVDFYAKAFDTAYRQRAAQALRAIRAESADIR